MTITDEERREVAEKLRGIELDPAWSALSVWCLVADACGANIDRCSRRDQLERLADLIEPPFQCPCYDSSCHRCSVHDFAIDRDALLALAEEMDNACPESASVAIGYIDDYALRIREALGVDHD